MPLFCYFRLRRDGNRKIFTSEMGKGEEEMEKKSRIQKMAVCSLFTALTAVGAFIRIPVR